MKRVIVESPYAGNIERNKRYAREAMADCLNRNEAPFASHMLYTQLGVLDDTIPEERQKGIQAGFVWGKVADLTVVYADLGITPGMDKGIREAKKYNRPVEYRYLYVKLNIKNLKE